MRIKNFLLSVAVVATAFTGRARAEDKPIDPRVVAWADYKPGTSVHLSGTILSGPSKGKIELVYTLMEVGDDKKSVVVRVDGAYAIANEQRKLPTALYKMPADKGKLTVQSLDPTDIDSGDKSYACRVYKLVFADEKGKEVKETIYISKDVPGLAKIEHVEKDVKFNASVTAVEEK